MVTNLASAALKDLMSVAFSSDYFELPQAKRNAAIEKHLGGNYPKALKNYLASVNEGDFESDSTAMIPILGSDGSVVAHASGLITAKNEWFSAFVDALSDMRSMEGDSLLAKTVKHFSEAGAQYKRVLDREMQQLLLLAKGKDSTIVQIAADVDIDTSKLAGVPSVEVNKSLIGGARTFENGQLKDESWRARLTEVISVIS